MYIHVFNASGKAPRRQEHLREDHAEETHLTARFPNKTLPTTLAFTRPSTI